MKGSTLLHAPSHAPTARPGGHGPCVTKGLPQTAFEGRPCIMTAAQSACAVRAASLMVPHTPAWPAHAAWQTRHAWLNRPDTHQAQPAYIGWDGAAWQINNSHSNDVQINISKHGHLKLALPRKPSTAISFWVGPCCLWQTEHGLLKKTGAAWETKHSPAHSPRSWLTPPAPTHTHSNPPQTPTHPCSCLLPSHRTEALRGERADGLADARDHVPVGGQVRDGAQVHACMRARSAILWLVMRPCLVALHAAPKVAHTHTYTHTAQYMCSCDAPVSLGQ